MKFVYQYRTRDNAIHVGTISAVDRESAFQSLKAQGIKPARLDAAPGVFNLLFGKGKRWIAIALLGISLTAAAVFIRAQRDEIIYAREDRAQLFGDPFVLQQLTEDGWIKAFNGNQGDAWLARHAIPGKSCSCSSDMEVQLNVDPVVIAESDGDELKKMKRMVNGMKAELTEYLRGGGSAEQYRRECESRLRVESNIQQSLTGELKTLERRLQDGGDRAQIEAEWNKKNATLRSMGLMTVPFLD